MKERESKPLNWYRIFGAVAVVFTAMVLTRPKVFGPSRHAGLRVAVRNAQEIAIALGEFKTAYGRFPGEATIPEVKSRTGSGWNLKSESSNDLFKQLVLAGFVPSESIFYCKQVGTRKADGNFKTEQRALAAGECGFAYLPSTVSGELDPERPLVVAPLIPGTMRFDPGPLEGKAVVSRADYRVRTYPIRPDGSVWEEGRNLFDPEQPFWRGQEPMVKWPRLVPMVMEGEVRDSVLAWVIGIATAGAIVLFVRYRALRGG